MNNTTATTASTSTKILQKKKAPNSSGGREEQLSISAQPQRLSAELAMKEQQALAGIRRRAVAGFEEEVGDEEEEEEEDLDEHALHDGFSPLLAAGSRSTSSKGKQGNAKANVARIKVLGKKGDDRAQQEQLGTSVAAKAGKTRTDVGAVKFNSNVVDETAQAGDYEEEEEEEEEDIDEEEEQAFSLGTNPLLTGKRKRTRQGPLAVADENDESPLEEQTAHQIKNAASGAEKRQARTKKSKVSNFFQGAEEEVLEYLNQIRQNEDDHHREANLNSVALSAILMKQNKGKMNKKKAQEQYNTDSVDVEQEVGTSMTPTTATIRSNAPGEANTTSSFFEQKLLQMDQAMREREEEQRQKWVEAMSETLTRHAKGLQHPGNVFSEDHPRDGAEGDPAAGKNYRDEESMSGVAAASRKSRSNSKNKPIQININLTGQQLVNSGSASAAAAQENIEDFDDQDEQYDERGEDHVAVENSPQFVDLPNAAGRLQINDKRGELLRNKVFGAAKSATRNTTNDKHYHPPPNRILGSSSTSGGGGAGGKNIMKPPSHNFRHGAAAMMHAAHALSSPSGRGPLFGRSTVDTATPGAPADVGDAQRLKTKSKSKSNSANTNTSPPPQPGRIPGFRPDPWSLPKSFEASRLELEKEIKSAGNTHARQHHPAELDQMKKQLAEMTNLEFELRYNREAASSALEGEMHVRDLEEHYLNETELISDMKDALLGRMRHYSGAVWEQQQTGGAALLDEGGGGDFSTEDSPAYLTTPGAGTAVGGYYNSTGAHDEDLPPASELYMQAPSRSKSVPVSALANADRSFGSQLESLDSRRFLNRTECDFKNVRFEFGRNHFAHYDNQAATGGLRNHRKDLLQAMRLGESIARELNLDNNTSSGLGARTGGTRPERNAEVHPDNTAGGAEEDSGSTTTSTRKVVNRSTGGFGSLDRDWKQVHFDYIANRSFNQYREFEAQQVAALGLGQNGTEDEVDQYHADQNDNLRRPKPLPPRYASPFGEEEGERGAIVNSVEAIDQVFAA
ncbi:unnamed protein product [Amoebophrya sp. A120]|nr:unnamed protein product [Amoebophrya sp. A120]|eukprot:GSA120T00016329001.1